MQREHASGNWLMPGYVVATHQTIRVKPGAPVITWCRPLADGSPREARARLANTDWKTWADDIPVGPARPHPELPGLLKRIDVWRWEHARCLPERQDRVQDLPLPDGGAMQ